MNTGNMRMEPLVHRLSDGGLLISHSLQKLKARLDSAVRNIPYYRKYNVQEAPGSVTAYLTHMPVLGKQDLVELDDALFDLDMERSVLISETSGTTGAGVLPTPRSLTELNWNSQNLAKILARHCKAGADKVAILHPVVMSPFADACCVALARIGVPYLRVFSVPGVCDYARILRILQDYAVTTVLTTPTLAAKLFFERDRIQDGRYASDWPVTKMLLTGECLTPEWSTNLRSVSGGTAILPFVYGSSEAATCMAACEAGHYHPLLDDFAFEIQSLDKSKPAEFGEKGVLLISWLNDGVRPLLRYRTDDLFTLNRDCVCGQDLAFTSSGRDLGAGLDEELCAAVEHLIGSLEAQTYHFELRLQEDAAGLVIITRRPLSPEAREHLLRELTILLDYPGIIKIHNNPETHEFMAAVTRPKLNRFIVVHGAKAAPAVLAPEPATQ